MFCGCLWGLAAGIGWMVLLRMKLKVLDVPYCIWFIFTTVVCMCFGWCAAFLAEQLWKGRECETAVCKIARVMFATTLLLNPHVTVNERTIWESVPDNAFVLMNHTSWLDSIIFVGTIPLWKIPSCRTLLKSTLCNLPVGGRIFRAAGHFPVFFKKEDGSWTVDQEKQAPVTERMNNFLKTDNAILAFYPEGICNRTPKNLCSFRRGSFQVMLDYDYPIYGYLMIGNDVCWHPDKGLPGHATHVDIELFKICDKASTLPEEIRATPGALAQYCQDAMQKELDRINRDRAGGITAAESTKKEQ